jgi:hypothetical protein
MALAKLAFQFLPTLPALLVAAFLAVVMMVAFPGPKKQELEQDFAQELADSKKTGRRSTNSRI